MKKKKLPELNDDLAKKVGDFQSLDDLKARILKDLEESENKRIMEIFVDLGSRPIIIIRLNPDTYKLAGKICSGAFVVAKSGTLQCNQIELMHRLQLLYEIFEDATRMIPIPTITTIKLFYDQ